MIRFVLYSMVILFASQVYADEHVEYTGDPISVTLAIGQERQIVFEETVKAGIPGVLVNQVNLNSVGNRVFIEALSEFKNQRLLVRGAESGITYVFTIQSSENVEPDPKLNVYLPKPKSTSSTPNQAWSASDQPINSYPFLTRYAMQQLYAPARLVKTHPAIQQLSMPGKPVMLFRCTPRSSACRNIKATPLVGFRTDRLFATALKLENIGHQAQEIDPRLIQVPNPNSLLTATAMHGRLHPKDAGIKAETVIVLIHDRPFRELMGGRW